MGTKKYVLNEELSGLPAARKHLNKWVFKFFKLLICVSLCRFHFWRTLFFLFSPSGWETYATRSTPSWWFWSGASSSPARRWPETSGTSSSACASSSSLTSEPPALWDTDPPSSSTLPQTAMHTLLLRDTLRCLQVRAFKRSICFLILLCKRALDIRVHEFSELEVLEEQEHSCRACLSTYRTRSASWTQPGWGWPLVMVNTQKWPLSTYNQWSTKRFEMVWAPLCAYNWNWPNMCPVSVLEPFFWTFGACFALLFCLFRISFSL